MKKNKIKKFVILLFLVSIAVELVVVIRAGGVQKNKSITQQEIKKYAQQEIEKCKNAPYHPSCYDKEIPKLMDKISMEDAFQVTKVVQDLDTSYPYCHVLGHELSAREVKKDPSKWKEVLTRCPSGLCSNGCLHGGLQERFRAESLNDSQIKEYLSDFETLCEPRNNWSPTGLEQGSCYHAMGHLMMYVTNANITKAISLCDKVSIKENGKDWRQLCYDGVFMQVYQPLEPEDFALVKNLTPKKENVDVFCSQYPFIQKDSCHSESWPLFLDEINQPQGLEKFCNNADISSKARCFNAMFYIITPRLHLEPARIINFCKGISTEWRGQCFANAASRLIEVDYRNITKAVALCDTANSLNIGDACYEELVTYSSYNFHSGSEKTLKICNSLPETWKTKCFARGKNSQK